MADILDSAGEKAVTYEMENAGGAETQNHRVEQKV
jgi:hypothetical protein